jgi:ketosteroid isomerase-like protein
MDSPNTSMDSTPTIAAANGSELDSPNMRAIKAAFQAFTERDPETGVNALLEIAHEDCLFRPYTAGGRSLRGREEVRSFFAEAAASGTRTRVRAHTFEEQGDAVVVTGSVRVMRPGGGFAESQVRWRYRFRDGLVEEASWAPRGTAD